MVIEAAGRAFETLPALSAGNDRENKTLMDKYYSYDFKQQYPRRNRQQRDMVQSTGNSAAAEKSEARRCRATPIPIHWNDRVWCVRQALPAQG